MKSLSKSKRAEYKETLRNRLTDYLKSKGMRQTSERYAILDKIIDNNTHFDVESLYDSLEKEFHVSKTTVYNTVDLLCACNIVRKHFLNENQATYDLADCGHIHLICTRCGNVKEVTDTKISDFISAQKFRGFSTFYSTTTLYGICSKCKRQSKSGSQK